MHPVLSMMSTHETKTVIFQVSHVLPNEYIIMRIMFQYWVIETRKRNMLP